MKLSAPVFRLKRQARLLSRETKIPLHRALDQIAKKEGFAGWSHLATQLSVTEPSAKLLGQLTDGDMLLLGGRPGHGKTTIALQLALEAVRTGRRAHFFTLDFNAKEVEVSAVSLDHSIKSLSGFAFDTSDEICADYIIPRMCSEPAGTLIVIDYLQLLDQARWKPSLDLQVSALQAFALRTGVILVFLSQIDRAYDATMKALPDLTDVRLPNPVDISLFSKTCFMNNGEMSLDDVA